MQTVEQTKAMAADDGMPLPTERGSTGEQINTGSDAESQNAAAREWEELIASDRYHALYTAHVSEIVKKRLGESRQQGALLQRAAAMMGLEDPSLLPERLAELLAPGQRDWTAEQDAVREKYPEFDLDAERASEPFAKLLEGFTAHPEISLTSLYELFHLDSLQEKAARQAAENTASQLLGAVQLRHARPHENGLAGAQANGAGRTSRLTRAQRAMLAERAAKGEHITF